MVYALNFSGGAQAITSRITRLSNLFRNVPLKTTVPEYSYSQNYSYEYENSSGVDPWKYVKQTVERELGQQNIDPTADIFTHEDLGVEYTNETTYVKNRLEQHLISQLQKVIHHLNAIHDKANISDEKSAKSNSSLNVIRTAMLSEVALLIVHLCQSVDTSRRVFTENVAYIQVLLAMLIVFTCSVVATNILARRRVFQQKVVLLEPSSVDESFRTSLLNNQASNFYYDHFEGNGVHIFRPSKFNDPEEPIPNSGTSVWILNDTADKLIKWSLFTRAQDQSVEGCSSTEQTQEQAVVPLTITSTQNTHEAVSSPEADQARNPEKLPPPTNSPDISTPKRNKVACTLSSRSPTTPLRARRQSDVRKVSESSERNSSDQSGMILRNGKATPRKPTATRRDGSLR